MPYNRSLPQETLQRLRAEIAIAFGSGEAPLRFSVEDVLARMIAMASYQMEGYIEYVTRQILPTTCDVEWLPLHAQVWKVDRREAAHAIGAVDFTGTNGSTIPAGTSLRHSNGQEYTLDADVTISGGVGTGDVTAVVSGAAGNAVDGATLTITSPVPGVQSTVIVGEDGLSGGVDIEDAETSWRGRIIARWQTPPHGGNAADYEMWAKEIAGVTRAWVYPSQLGVGSVYLLFVMDEKVGTIIPSAPEVELVQNHIDVQRPATADAVVAAPTPVALDFEINISPNTLAVRTAIQAELEDLIRRESIPGGTLLLSHIREVISIAIGEHDHALVSPSANVTRDFGDITTIGNITFGAL